MKRAGNKADMLRQCLLTCYQWTGHNRNQVTENELHWVTVYGTDGHWSNPLVVLLVYSFVKERMM